MNPSSMTFYIALSTTTYIALGIAVLLAISIQTIWIFNRYDNHRLRRILGLRVPSESGPRHKLGRFYWQEGVFAGEVTQLMSAEYAEKHRWLLSHKNQRRFVVLLVVSWLLNLFGAFDVSWNLGFAGSLFSWWSVLVVVAYLVLRQSVRALADAPSELIDERLTEVRDSAYRSAYRLLGWIIPILGGFAFAAYDATDAALTLDQFAFGLFCFGFIFEGLPSMFIAWRGKAKGVN
ncbi:MAG: hypothetical protein EBV02_01455 [Actinobacteria bacterium]|nr:hypothetical protein [Actinomycetota bacterium]